MNPSYEYELLHQFEVIFRDGEHKTQAASRDYSNVWENVIDNPPDEGVTPVHVYRMNGTTCAVIAGMDELVENEECAMEIVRLATALAACASQSKRVAVEAKIEALEEMVPLVCPDCAAGAPDDGSFNHWEGRQVSEDDWEQEQYECRASAIREKIAALRKELGE